MAQNREDRNLQAKARRLALSRVEIKYPELWKIEFEKAKETILKEQAELEEDLDKSDFYDGSGAC
jgi:hypothetical protein